MTGPGFPTVTERCTTQGNDRAKSEQEHSTVSSPITSNIAVDQFPTGISVALMPDTFSRVSRHRLRLSLDLPYSFIHLAMVYISVHVSSSTHDILDMPCSTSTVRQHVSFDSRLFFKLICRQSLHTMTQCKRMEVLPPTCDICRHHTIRLVINWD